MAWIWVVIALAVLLMIARQYFTETLEENGKDKTGSKNKDGKRSIVQTMMDKTAAAWNERKKAAWIFYPAFFLGFYFMIGKVLKSQDPQLWEPWKDHPDLFFFWLPLVILATALALSLLKKEHRLVPLTTGGILCVLCGIFVLLAYKDSAWWKENKEKIPWFAGGQTRVTEYREKSRGSRNLVTYSITAYPGVWSKEEPIRFMQHLDFDFDGHCVAIRINRDNRRIYHIKPGDDYRKYARDAKVIEFMSDESGPITVQVAKYDV